MMYYAVGICSLSLSLSLSLSNDKYNTTQHNTKKRVLCNYGFCIFDLTAYCTYLVPSYTRDHIVMTIQ